MPLEYVRELEALREGQQRTLFRLDGEYIVVSTVAELLSGDPARDAMLSIGAFAGAMLGRASAVSGEETMAFRSDDEGEIDDWGEIAVANGPGSREAVLRQLGGGA